MPDRQRVTPERWAEMTPLEQDFWNNTGMDPKDYKAPERQPPKTGLQRAGMTGFGIIGYVLLCLAAPVAFVILLNLVGRLLGL